MWTVSYRRHRFPPEIIQHAVWLYFRFPLSYRNVEDLLAERGIDVSYETVRRWALKFGRLYARRLRRLRSRPSGRWHLDEVFARIGGKRMYLWRAVDDKGEVLDVSSAWGAGIKPAAGSTIERKTRTFRSDSESAGCWASRRQRQRSASSPPTPRSTTPSTSSVT